MKTNTTFFDFVKVGGLSVLVFLLFAPGAFAYTYERTPAGNVSEPGFTISWAINDIAEFCPEFGGQPPAQNYRIGVFDLVSAYGSAINSDWYGAGTLAGSFFFESAIEYPVKFVYVTCDTGGGNITEAVTILEANAGEIIFTITEPPPTIAPTSMRFSLTKPDEPNLLASVGTPLTGSVIETGKAIWPMFVFVGVLLAFIIALQMVVFLRRSVGTPKKGRKNDIPDDVDPRDYRAYRRGKKLIEKDSPDFYKD